MRHQESQLERALALQVSLLPGVSRTFALTIPQLPEPLRVAVTNAYLLCRIADTIEDDAGLDAEQKRAFHRGFVAVVRASADPRAFARELEPRLGPHTPAPERALIRELPEVVRVTHAFESDQRAALERCIGIMCAGMPQFQHSKSVFGLATVADLDRYCYHVAGVVGEMLTELFCNHSREIARRRGSMMSLAVRFGQGLQMTNILKDFWEDRARRACWLPREVFQSHGLDLSESDSEQFQQRFSQGLKELIAMTHACLRDALSYVHLIPRRETGIRRFCLWAIGMAVLTLRRIQRNPGYRSQGHVKISRRAVKATVLVGTLLARSNAALQMAFNLVAQGLPLQPRPVTRAVIRARAIEP